MGQRSMDSILSDEPSLHTLPEGPESDSPSDATEPADTSSSGVTSKQKVEAKASKVTEQVADDDTDEEGDPVDQSFEGLKRALTAVRGDKRKMRKQWQDAQRKVDDTNRRIAQLEGQLTVFQQMGARNAEPQRTEAQPQKVDFYGDPEQYISHRERAIREEIRAEQFKRDATRSERRMRRDHQDYEEAKGAFMQAVQSNPQLWSRVVEDPEPAEFVYDEGRKLLRGGISEREAQLAAELEELKAKLSSGSGETSRAPARSIPKPSIASARGTGAGVPQAWSGPRSTKEIFGD